MEGVEGVKEGEGEGLADGAAGEGEVLVGGTKGEGEGLAATGNTLAIELPALRFA